MEMISKKSITILNFSNIYKVEKLVENNPEFDVHELDLSQLPGTNCYCDQDAYLAIRERLDKECLHGIHFIDSGNYHYMSRIWAEMVEVPFQLIVFDHHTDMQLPAFGGLLSCGGWIADSLEVLKNLQKVVLLGPPEQDYEQVEECFKEKTIYIPEKNISILSQRITEVLDKNLPIYISIDKDILCKEEAMTNWSQGELKLSLLLEVLHQIVCFAFNHHQDIIAVDICGECSLEEQKYQHLNDDANQKIIDLIKDMLQKESL